MLVMPVLLLLHDNRYYLVSDDDGGVADDAVSNVADFLMDNRGCCRAVLATISAPISITPTFYNDKDLYKFRPCANGTHTHNDREPLIRSAIVNRANATGGSK